MPRTCSGYADIEPIWPQDRGSPGQIYGHGVDLDQLHGRPGVATSAITYDKGPCRVRKNVLVVAGGVELRARIARVLHSAGYNAELAENPKRALELAARKDIHAAIVVQSRHLANLGQELRDKIPTTILLGTETKRSFHQAVRFKGKMDSPKTLWVGRSLFNGSAGPPAL